LSDILKSETSNISRKAAEIMHNFYLVSFGDSPGGENKNVTVASCHSEHEEEVESVASSSMTPVYPLFFFRAGNCLAMIGAFDSDRSGSSSSDEDENVSSAALRLGRKRGGRLVTTSKGHGTRLVSGNVASYSCMLNDPKRLAEIKELNELTSAVGEVSADKLNEKKRKKEKMIEEQKSKKVKEQKQREERSKKISECRPLFQALLEPFETGRITATMEQISLQLSLKQMKDILKYYYSPPAGLSKMNKESMARCIAEQLGVSMQNTAEINAAAPNVLSTNAYNTHNE
jgi:ElaB/YqjD/DUF883 family membrane-anchored ribosome-binding protein